MTTTQTELPHDVTFPAGVMKVLANMGRKLTQTDRPQLEEDEDLRAYQGRVRLFDRHYVEMARSLGVAMTYVAAPGVRLWPDNSREDCLSLSGSLRGMSFGIIFHANADGTGTWSFHS